MNSNSNKNSNTNDFVIKSYSRKELRNMYDVSEPVFSRWLAPYIEEWGLVRIRQFSPEQVAKIVNAFGPPF